MKLSTQMLRCYTVPDEKPKKPDKRKRERREDGPKKHANTQLAQIMREIGRPWSGPMLILDCETTTGVHTGQALRFGRFQERGLLYSFRVEDARRGTLTREKLDRPRRAGIFYNPATCTEEEIALMKSYAEERRLEFMTRDEFLKRVFYHGWPVKPKANEREPKLVIGHNLPFDLGALCERAGLSRGDDYGGLTLTLLDEPIEITKEEREKKLPPNFKPLPPELQEKLANVDIAALSAEERESLYREAGEPIGNVTNRDAAITKRLRALKKAYSHLKIRHYPSIVVKKIGFGKHMITAHGDVNGQHNLKFLDTMMLARALLGPGELSLGALIKRLNIKDAKKGSAAFSGPITREFLDYCGDDVEATWRIYQELRALYRQHGVSRDIDTIYSEASIGKSYLTDLGVTPFLKQNPNFDPRVCGAFMEALCGGRADARIRHKIVEGVLADFKSQYPTANALMGLQELMIAEKIVARIEPGETSEAKHFLETATLEDLGKPETWKRLRGVALIEPHNDILPVRTEYQDDDAAQGENATFPASDVEQEQILQYGEKPARIANIGVNLVKSGPPTYYTFAHIIVSKLLTGKCPKIIETIELVPEGRQAGLKPVRFFGDERFTIDLAVDDLFTRVIELRTEIQEKMKGYDKASNDYALHNSMQKGAKLTANATSYGILIEIIVDEHKERIGTTVYHGFDVKRKQARARTIGEDGRDEISGYKAEKPGSWFASYGVLIPAAGHLLLAIAETLAAQRGINYAFCDTDSMFFARPDDMPREEFLARVQEIAGPRGWFQRLNPYRIDVPIFALEDVNFRLKNDTSGKVQEGVFEPLHCLVVSSKRYALFNRGYCGEIIMRKASAHGLGDVGLPQDYNPLSSQRTCAEHIAAPLGKNDRGEPVRQYGDLAQGAGARFFLDIWRIAIEQFERGEPERIDEIIGGLEGLNRPQFTQQSLSTRNAWLTYENLPNKRPFMFFGVLPALRPDYFPAETVRGDELKALQSTSLYASLDEGLKLNIKTLEEYRALGAGNEGIYRRDNNQFPYDVFDDDWSLRFTTVADRLRGYFSRPERKSRGSVGLLQRKAVVCLDKEYIGKETNPLALRDDAPDDETLDEFEASIPIFRRGLNVEALKALDLDALAARAGINRETLRQAVSQEQRLSFENMQRLRRAIIVSNDGELSLAPFQAKTAQDQRLASLRRKIGKIGDYGRIAAEMNKSAALAGEAPIEWPPRGSSLFLNTLEAIMDGGPLPPRCNREFLDRVEKAIKDASGATRAEERRAKENARKSGAKERVTAIRARRMDEKIAACKAAWDEGERIEGGEPTITDADLPRAYDGRRLRIKRHVATVITRGEPGFLVPYFKGSERIIAKAWRRAFMRAKSGDEFVDQFGLALTHAFEKTAARREKVRKNVSNHRARRR